MVPDFQSIMLPLLRLTDDGAEHRLTEAVEKVGSHFQLTEDEQAELLPSGRQPKFYNRVQWAKTYLAQAGLLDNTRRSHFRITDRGKKVLLEAPSHINIEFLNQFPEFVEFKTREKVPRSDGTTGNAKLNTSPSESAETPDELLRGIVTEVEAALAKEVLQRILTSPPSFFESTIVALLLAMGYGGSREEAGRAIGKTGDGGLDGVIDQDPLGLDRVYIQAKRYKSDLAISEPDIRGFSGSLGAAKANKGVFVTTSYFTKPALEFAERHPFKMVLIDGDQLAELMIRHNVGVRVAETILLKKVDEDFFPEA
jgi:restriction system protein